MPSRRPVPSGTHDAPGPTDARRNGPGRLDELLDHRGDQRLLFWPVRDQERVSRLIALLTFITGVEGVTIEDYDGHDLQLTAHVTGPVSTSPQLRARLERGIVSCAMHDGRIDVQIAPRSTGAPGPGALPPSTASPAAGGSASEVVPPGLRRHATPGTAWPDPDPASAPAGPRPVARRRWAADAPPRTDELIGSAVRSLSGRSMLVCDADLRVRAITGPAYGRRPDLGDPSPGREVRDLLPGPIWAALAPGLAGALAGEVGIVEFDGPPTGARYRAECAPIVDDGVVIGAAVVARDVADGHAPGTAVAALQGDFDDVFDESPVGQALVSVEGRWVRVNAALRLLLEAEPEDLPGRPVVGWVHPAERAGITARFDAVLAGREEAAPTRLRLLGAEGRGRVVVVHPAVLRDPSGSARGLVLQFVDAQG